MKTKLVTNLLTYSVVGVLGVGAFFVSIQLEKAFVSVDQTTVITKVNSAFIKRGSGKSSSDMYLLALDSGKVVEVTDLWSLGQVESASLFGQFQSVAGEDCLVAVTYGGFDNPWLSLHPLVIASKTDLTCK